MLRIAVVGAGIAGLACARSLRNAGHAVRVFEKSRGAGGRMSTRRTDHGSYDHGAQYFTARDPLFRAAVDQWLAQGLVAPYAGRIVRLEQGEVIPLSHPEQRYVATPGMTAVCRALSADLEIDFECQITAVTPGESGWRLSWEEGGDSGFDAVVLAIPAAQASPLCVAVPDLAVQLRQGGHEPCWAAMVRYEAPLPLEFDAAFVESDVIGWVMRDASRPGRVPGERWVLHANAEWSKAHLENSAETVAPLLMDAFCAAAGFDAEAVEFRAHRWRFALSRGLNAGSFWHAGRRIGACGDWCADGRIEGAYLSGTGLAAKLRSAL
ncbi:MAG: NAD(P)/FAD-dependent oxidoreductase [Burkholderiales bacterium]